MRQGRVTIRVGILCHKPIGPHSEDMLLICRIGFPSLTLPSKVLELSVQPTGSEHDYISYSLWFAWISHTHIGSHFECLFPSW